jgi:hypothetical protein
MQYNQSLQGTIVYSSTNKTRSERSSPTKMLIFPHILKLLSQAASAITK